LPITVAADGGNVATVAAAAAAAVEQTTWHATEASDLLHVSFNFVLIHRHINISKRNSSLSKYRKIKETKTIAKYAQ